MSADASRLPEDWAALVGAHVPDLHTIYLSPTNVLPHRTQVFRAFHATPFREVRVVLLGQDPYFRARMANGLAFAQTGPIDKGSALHRMLLNLKSDPAVPFFTQPTTGDLTKWTDQGVLLLNAALTVVEDDPKSHLKRWQEFVKAVLRHFDDPQGDVAFILLGRDAIKLARLTLRNVRTEALIQSAHPMAGNSGNARPFHTSYVFTEANVFLGAARAVDWTLT